MLRFVLAPLVIGFLALFISGLGSKSVSADVPAGIAGPGDNGGQPGTIGLDPGKDSQDGCDSGGGCDGE